MANSALISVLPLDANSAFTRHPADSRLAGHVDCYWTLTVTTPPARLRMIPDGRIDIVFDLDTQQAFITSASYQPFEAEHLRPTRLLGAGLLPAAAASLLGTDIGALSGAWQPLETFLGPLAGRLAASISAASDGARQISLLEAVLLARIDRADGRVARALQAISDTGGTIGLPALGRASGASPRNLGRLFYTWVGMPPKSFARIERVQEALRRLRTVPPPPLKALAAELGFADQAHLSREVTALTGASPSQLAEIFKREAEIFKP